MLGAAAATGIPRCRSMRCLPKLAAYAELPRAHVTTTRGGRSLSDAQSRLNGRPSSSDWRDTTSGDSRSSAAINCSPLLTELPVLVQCYFTSHLRSAISLDFVVDLRVHLFPSGP